MTTCVVLWTNHKQAFKVVRPAPRVVGSAAGRQFAGENVMSTGGWIVLIVVLLVLFGGGGGYYYRRRR